jgi:class 3 adenylate cyclase
MLGLWLLLAQPELELRWEHKPVHFWLVLGTAAVCVGLAVVINEAARRRYFDVATRTLLGDNGTIVQYVGDALMAMFNAPIPQPDHAVPAARAALAMQRGVDASRPRRLRGWPRFRIGVKTGEALVGNIGSEVLRNVNATGDVVTWPPACIRWRHRDRSS